MLYGSVAAVVVLTCLCVVLARTAEACSIVSGYALARLERVTGSRAAAAIAMTSLLRFDTAVTTYPSLRGRLALRVVRMALRRLVALVQRYHGVTRERAEASVVHMLGVWSSGVADLNTDPVADFLGK